jgi:hemolysin activation/secretion protein
LTLSSLGLYPLAVAAAESRDHLNVQEIERPAYLPTQPGDPFLLPPVAPLAEPATDEPAAIKVERIVFKGNTVVPTAELDALAAPYCGRQVSVAELETLRQRLTRHYIDLGYVNSGVLLLKESPVSRDGSNVVANAAANVLANVPANTPVVVFAVIEGRLTTLRLQGMDGLDERYIAHRLLKEGDGPLNMNRLRERYQLLLSDPLFTRLNARLMPGEQLGAAILDMEVVRAKPYQLTLFANNSRPPSIGSESLGVSGWLRNLTGQGDVLEASVQTPHNRFADSRLSLAWRMPIGQRGAEFSAAIEHGRSSVIEEPMQILDIRSMLDTRDIGLNQTLLETLRHKLALGVNHVWRENRTTLLGSPFSFNPGEPDGVSKEVLWRFWQEYTYRSETQVLALRSTFSFGKNNLQTIADLPANNTVITPQQHYQIWLGQAQYARQVLDNGAQVLLRGSIQRTQEKLLPLDGMSIGGVNTVRGYRENQLIRDNGATVSLEFDYPLFEKSAHGLNLSLIPFYDVGRGQNRNEPAVTLSSWGLASRLRWQGFHLDIAVAHRLSHPASIQHSTATLQDRGIHFNLSYNY